MGALTALAGVLPVIWPKLVGTDLLVPVLSYNLAIMTLLWLTLSGRRHNRLMAAVGALTFAGSDLLIFVNRFYMPVSYAHIIVHVTYYLAQFLLATSVALFAPPTLAKKRNQ